MASEKQIEANRANGRKAADKPRNMIRSRLNAINHGLLAVGITEIDNADSYLALLNQLRQEYEPVGEVESFLVERIALGIIRVRRSVRFESEAITAALHPERRSKSRLDEQMEAQLAEIDGETSIIDPGFHPELRCETVGSLTEALARYETQHERRLFRTIEQIERLQTARRKVAQSDKASAANPNASK
jgi:hypothetical protein